MGVQYGVAQCPDGHRARLTELLESEIEKGSSGGADGLGAEVANVMCIFNTSEQNPFM